MTNISVRFCTQPRHPRQSLALGSIPELWGSASDLAQMGNEEMQLGEVIACLCRRGAVSGMHDSWKWSGIFFSLGDLGLCGQLRALFCRTRKENRDFYCLVHRNRINSCLSTKRNPKLYFDVESRFGRTNCIRFPGPCVPCSCQLLMANKVRHW